MVHITVTSFTTYLDVYYLIKYAVPQCVCTQWNYWYIWMGITCNEQLKHNQHQHEYGWRVDTRWIWCVETSQDREGEQMTERDWHLWHLCSLWGNKTYCLRQWVTDKSRHCDRDPQWKIWKHAPSHPNASWETIEFCVDVLLMSLEAWISRAKVPKAGW